MFGEAKLWQKICMSIGTEAYQKRGCSQSLIIRVEYYKRSRKTKGSRAGDGSSIDPDFASLGVCSAS
jgi:hypothetical protein